MYIYTCVSTCINVYAHMYGCATVCSESTLCATEQKQTLIDTKRSWAGGSSWAEKEKKEKVVARVCVAYRCISLAVCTLGQQRHRSHAPQPRLQRSARSYVQASLRTRCP